MCRGDERRVNRRSMRKAFREQSVIQVVQGKRQRVDTSWLIHLAEWSSSARARKAAEFIHMVLGPHN